MARCSEKRISSVSLRVAVAFAAATLFVCTITEGANAAVQAEGLDSAWLKTAAERSLNAVHEHMPAEESAAGKRRLMSIVADKLLSGYDVDEVVRGDDDETLVVRLRRTAESPEWQARIQFPNLNEPVKSWFAADCEGLEEEFAALMRGVPIEALTWGDAELKRVVDEACEKRLPGWRPSLIVRSSGGTPTLEVGFSPQQPIVLALSPRISSTSIPALLYLSLKTDLTKGLAPIIGVPVSWLDLHKEDFVLFSSEVLENESLVEKAVAKPEVTALPGTVAEIDVDLESRRYSFSVRMAVYAGAEGKYPEASLHFGRRAMLVSGWDMELYLETITTLDDFDTEARLGMRWSPWRNIWLGGEWSSDDDIWWARVGYETPRLRKPYFWMRLSEEGDSDGAVGLRLTEFFSIEVHYDSRDDESWNIRAIVNL